MLLVALAGLDRVLGRLGLGDGLFDGDEPAITLRRVLGLEGVLVAGELDGEGQGAVLDEVGGIGQVEDTGRVLLLVGVLDEEQEALAGLAGPGDRGVGDLGLLAAQVLPQVGRLDGLLAEPEVLLGEAEGAGSVVSTREMQRATGWALTS